MEKKTRRYFFHISLEPFLPFTAPCADCAQHGEKENSVIRRSKTEMFTHCHVRRNKKGRITRNTCNN
ncbi:hypothetical protein WN48_07481 [Eufriesea mexicana]|uniref:Uncharacterized protein n=1 Tax=Eufriesea mexicana TaxID=516756 RepID=A0A310SYJ1_9HYME|nr:hypothetical protein WN48_07481 [Eufriesea mexicana]